MRQGLTDFPPSAPYISGLFPLWDREEVARGYLPLFQTPRFSLGLGKGDTAVKRGFQLPRPHHTFPHFSSLVFIGGPCRINRPCSCLWSLLLPSLEVDFGPAENQANLLSYIRRIKSDVKIQVSIATNKPSLTQPFFSLKQRYPGTLRERDKTNSPSLNLKLIISPSEGKSPP